jgi:hypothetical protein
VRRGGFGQQGGAGYRGSVDHGLGHLGGQLLLVRHCAVAADKDQATAVHKDMRYAICACPYAMHLFVAAPDCGQDHAPWLASPDAEATLASVMASIHELSDSSSGQHAHFSNMELRIRRFFAGGALRNICVSSLRSPFA